MTDLELYEEIVRIKRSGEPAALATVVASAGSSPRKPGAKMLVHGDGSILGTVGGGRVEAETLAAARAVMAEGTPRTLAFTLTEEHGFACGGSLTLFVEPLGSAPRLVVFGAGHVGKTLTQLAAGCGFRVTVVDDRPDYARREELPGAGEVICTRPEDAFARLQLDGQSVVVIATPGHRSDFEAVRGALATPAGFIGLVGSVRKRAALLETLSDEGYAAIEIVRVVTPVGLDIGAETPEEIAVSIVAQLVRRRRGERGERYVGNPAGCGRFAADGAVQAAPAAG